MYDEKSALRVKKFVEKLKHSKGIYAGQNFILEDWQWSQIISPLYGTLNPDGSRQYRTCFIFVARKNGKTSLGATLSLYHLFADHEQGGEIYSAAVDKDQASLVFDEAAMMDRQNKSLSRKSKIIDSRKRIVNYRTNSFYKAIPANVAGAYGGNISCVIYDELHAAANRELYDVLKTSSGTRRQPLFIIITTAGYDRNSILWEVYNYAKKVKKGIIKDDTFLPVIYEVSESDDWEDEKVWYKANPALGTFRSLEEMRSLYRYAKENPGFINTFKRLYLNMWTSQETRWLDIVKWDACPHEISLENLKGKICYGGLDLSATTDLTAFVLAFEDYSVLPFFFIPRQRMAERIKTDKVPYDVWERQGHVIVTEGEVIDYGAVEKKIDELLSLYQIKQINYDRWNADYLVQRLTARGYLNMVQIGMGYQSMNSPTKYLESLILEGKLNHGGNPILRWNFDNCMLSTDPAGNIKPDKSKSTQRIDGIVATVMALDGLMRNLKKTSIYETQKIKVF